MIQQRHLRRGIRLDDSDLGERHVTGKLEKRKKGDGETPIMREQFTHS
jgi:hypothetical protein